MQMIFIPIAFIAVGILFFIFINKKYKKASAEIDIEQERPNYEAYFNSVLNTNLTHLKAWMKDAPIDAITSGSIPESRAGKLAKIAVDGIKDKFRSSYHRSNAQPDNLYYWILSGDNVHFISTDTDFELKEHLVFEKHRLAQAKLEYHGLLNTDMNIVTNSTKDSFPIAHIITFYLDNAELSLEIHDRLKIETQITNPFKVKELFVKKTKYRVVGENFLPKLQKLYSNLRIEQTVVN